MRNISFSLTTKQFKARTKTVTRRIGWKNLQAGDMLMACEQCQGLKRGEKVKHLGAIIVTSVRREALSDMLATASYGSNECILEGFPELSPFGFVEMFCGHNRCSQSVTVTRIEYAYL